MSRGDQKSRKKYERSLLVELNRTKRELEVAKSIIRKLSEDDSNGIDNNIDNT